MQNPALPKARPFNRFAKAVSHVTGQPITFLLAVVTMAVWGATGPIFGFSNTWQLVINTGTTFTAVFALGDAIAYGLIEAAFAHGLSVPGDLSVVGFDDIETHVRAEPGLTTVRQSAQAKGRAAAELLMAELRGDSVDNTRIIAPIEFIKRGTTAPVAAAA